SLWGHPPTPLLFFFSSVLSLPPPPLPTGPLTVVKSRLNGGTMVIAFEGYDDRVDAERLRGTLLTVDIADLPASDDPDEFYDHQLIGLAVRDLSGAELGVVTDVLHPPASPVLQVRTPAAQAVLVPFVSAIVPEVVVADGYLMVDPPDGLFAPTEEV
ncbi:MAG: ribosome maturation factor RimM, partial [Nakamurella sp.]